MTLMQEDYQAVVFTLGREQYALPIQQVQEIIRMPVITSLPRKNPWYLGISNLRGQIVPLIDLGQKLLGSPSSFDENTRVIIIECGTAMVGVTVDAVNEVVRISQDCMVDLADIKEVKAHQLTGIARMSEQLVLLLDIEQALFN